MGFRLRPIKLKGIVFDFISEQILIRQDQDGGYLLPAQRMRSNENHLDSFRTEIEVETNVKLKFVKTLPTTWYQLAFTSSPADEHFTITSIFDIYSSENSKVKPKPRNSDYKWTEISLLDSKNLLESDWELVKQFLDIII